MGLQGIKAGLDSLASAFTAVTAPAAELENASAKPAVVLGDAAAADRRRGTTTGHGLLACPW